MTILSVCRDAAVKMNQPQPDSVFSTTDTFAAELLLQAKETAASLLQEEIDWRDLTQLATCQGDASTVVFPLATVAPGYQRMVKGAKLHSLRFRNATFRWARDLDEWLYIKDSLLVGSPGNAVILGGSLQIFPAMPADDTARFYYISNKIVLSAAGTPKVAFTSDDDTFALDERLLYLGVVWRWLASKKMEYSEPLKDFEVAKMAVQGKDKGNTIITVGRQRVSRGNDVAYPALLG